MVEGLAVPRLSLWIDLGTLTISRHLAGEIRLSCNQLELSSLKLADLDGACPPLR